MPAAMPLLYYTMTAAGTGFHDYHEKCINDQVEPDVHKPLVIGYEPYDYVVEVEVVDDDEEDDEPAAAASSSSSSSSGGTGEKKKKTQKVTRKGCRIALATTFMLSHRPEQCCADATHKMAIANVVVLPIGFNDAQVQWQGVLIVISTTETAADYEFGFQAWSRMSEYVRFDARYEAEGCIQPVRVKKLLADGDPAIRNGFMDAFGARDDEEPGPNHPVPTTYFQMCGNHAEGVRMFPLSSYIYTLAYCIFSLAYCHLSLAYLIC